jgi:hypothetical protein
MLQPLLAAASLLVMISGVAFAQSADHGSKAITIQRSGPDNTGSKLITIQPSEPGEMASNNTTTDRYDRHGKVVTSTVTEPESGMTETYRVEH